MDDDNVRTKIFIGDYISIGVLDIYRRKEIIRYYTKNKSYCILYKGKLIKFYLSLFKLLSFDLFFYPSLYLYTLYIFDLTLLYIYLYLYITRYKKNESPFYIVLLSLYKITRSEIKRNETKIL